MKASDIPGKIQLPFGASAGGSYIHAVPVASQTGITPGAASYTDGFVPLNFLDPLLGGVPPDGQDLNGILNAISALSRWFISGSPVPWDGTFSTAIGGYPKGAIVQSATTFGTVWVCTVDDNLTNPDAAGAGWELLTTFLGISTDTTILNQTLGFNQTWQDETVSRAIGGGPYTNGTGKPISVVVTMNSNGSPVAHAEVNGAQIMRLNFNSSEDKQVTFIVPPTQTYQIILSSGTLTLVQWSELR